MHRRTFLKESLLGLGALALGCRAVDAAPTPPGTQASPSEAELAQALMQNIAETEAKLANYPLAQKRVKKYLEGLHRKTSPSCSRIWLAYQADRLQRIRWLVDRNDDGRQSGMPLKMRPYDIPWLIWALGKTATPELRDEYAKKTNNGVVENVDKVLAAPEVEIVFTDQFADFCYLCSALDTEGCRDHKEFAGYGTTFPQAVQMSPTLRKDADAILRILGLKWEDRISGKALLELCASKAPNPAEIADFPLPQDSWDHYRAGIARIKKA